MTKDNLLTLIYLNQGKTLEEIELMRMHWKMGIKEEIPGSLATMTDEEFTAFTSVLNILEEVSED